MSVELGAGGWRPAGGKPLGYALKVWAFHVGAESDRRPCRTGGSPVPAGRVPTLGEQDPGEEPRWGSRPLRDFARAEPREGVGYDPDEYEVGSGGTSRSLPELDDRPVLTDRAEVVLRALEDERIEASRALDLLSERRAGPAAWTPQRYFRERAEERLEARRTT